MEIGQRFKTLREEKGLSQEDIGQRIGQQRRIVARFETLGSNPKWDTVRQMLGALGVSLAEFFESNIPARYADPAHQEAHEKLQAILESKDASGCLICLEGIYRMVMEERARSAPKKAVASQRREA